MKKKILIGIICITMLITAVADFLMFNTYSAALDKAFPVKTDNSSAIESATENALSVAQSIEEEGAVLLKNNGALPLSEEKVKINLLGYGAYHPVYGGTGSGGSSYIGRRVSLVEAFEKNGFEINPNLEAIYPAVEGEGENTFLVDFKNPEPAATEALAQEMGQEYRYTGDCSFEKMKEYSDIAVVVICRKGGEGNDLPTEMSKWTEYEKDKSKHYLELNSPEISLIENAKANFGTVIVLINTGNAMELGFLETEQDYGVGIKGDIDSALWIGGIGDVGAYGVAEILKGEISPSGKTVDIYPYEVESIPSYYNFGVFEYTNSDDSFRKTRSPHPAYLVEYQEGIYVGYRYFETRTSYDYVTREGEQKTNLTYDEVVQYPFGYGLSYTSFEWELSKAPDLTQIGAQDTLVYEIKVTNTGETKGKDVVELYYTAPYYSEGSRIQKPEVVLGGFAKTKELEPGESEVVSIEIPVEQMASYDGYKYYAQNGGYVLEEGTYKISIRTDSHTVKNNMVYSYEIPETIVFADDTMATEHSQNAVFVGKRSGDEVVAENQFEDVLGDVIAMNRDDWTLTSGTDKEATEEQLNAFYTAFNLDKELLEADVEAPLWDQMGFLTLKDMTGKPYDDPDWDKLISQISLDEIHLLLANNGWGTPQMSSIGKPQIYDMDGPPGLFYVLDMFTSACTYKAVSYPTTVVLASTWNKDIAEEFGASVAKEGAAWNISGWYAPGANLHRNPFSGRNFEYYSEDPYLSGVFCSSIVKNAEDNGMYCYMKHFALNEMETNRHSGLCTWADEQTIRELYLVPFEWGVKEGESTAIMSAYNFIGTRWTGGSKALLTEVLREEWGFIGTVVTDNVEERGFMDIEVAIMAGGSTLFYNTANGLKYCNQLKKTPAGQQYLKEAAHQYLYTIANSNVVEKEDVQAPWRTIAIGVSAGIYLAGAVSMVVVLRRKRG